MAQKLCCDDAWNMQSGLPPGATLLGTILSSDKMNISVLTGNHVAHPLLVSLANICMNTQLKSSSNSFMLTALLPVTKFLHKNKCMCGVLADCLVHQCLNIVLKPLKEAALHGVMLLNLVGQSCYCFTPLASYIVDTPEAMMLACIGGRTSPVTMAMYKQFGDSFRHEPRTASTILAQISIVRTRANPSDLQAFFCEAQKFHLNGVFKPFWLGWVLTDPSRFFTPETLHSPSIDKNDLVRISAALNEFHANKDAIIDARVRRGKANKVISNWYIPKLELMQSVVPSIRNSGVTAQWSTDATEHAHITEIKDPERSNEKQNIKVLADAARSHMDDEDIDDIELDDDVPIEFLSMIQHGRSRPITNYFTIAQVLQHKPVGSIPLPLRSFVTGRIAFHLAYDPSIRNISIDDVTLKFNQPDLRPAQSDFLHHEVSSKCDHIHAIGGPRRARPNAVLPFEKVQVWFKLCLQDTEFMMFAIFDQSRLSIAHRQVNLGHTGHYDSIIVSTKAEHSWPTSGLQGTSQLICPSPMLVINLIPQDTLSPK
ncbi:hypothetical protein DFJ58DRAFT_846769 [Suillus subalutaceus]|uniref:uncharacterized protein n=1 Tax=Suillus subalutaceus TaxID=48586 RepID=UPI001B883ED3|nr:uncharacterized protein DFJ58DRAFT_846769 [Suillus subalutaceus]KAG1836785.1 hypothetical protein DFJ58DRAFT_846769 [Suillus subalutaceus]